MEKLIAVEKLSDMVARWAKMSFKENPYGEPIPDKYLYNSLVMADGKKVRSLAECMQNGFVLNWLYNDPNKKSAAEDEETITFSDTFHRLEREGTLCPSNYVVGIIRDLEKWDAENNTRHSEAFFCETIARSLRTFASMLRENNLREIIDQFLKIEAIRRRFTYKMFPASVDEDVKAKTDIAIKYGGAFYRIWSYQVTQPGVKKTSNRIKRGAGKGFNILMPFDINDSEYVHGWAFYHPEQVKELLREFVIARQTRVQTHYMYKKLVEANPEIVKVPTIFVAA